MKRVLFFILAILIFLAVMPKSIAHAQDTWKFASPKSFGSALEGEDNNAQASWFSGLQYSSYGLTCMSIGTPCSSNPDEGAMFFQKSVLGQVGTAIAMTYINKPADFGLWLADTGHTLGFLPKPVYAQGVGFFGLAALLPVWKAFRNIAYLLMAVVMIAVGFMIMFRKKIDPKTVVTAQNAIPRIIIALILITFSYAIVGIMVDVMYIVLYFAIALFKSTGYLDAPGWWATTVFKLGTPEALYSQGSVFAQLSNIDLSPMKAIAGWQWTGGQTLMGSAFATLLLTVVGSVAGAPALGILGLALPLVQLLMAVFLLILFIRLLFFFFGAYIQIILALIIGPLQLLLEAFPGSTAFSSWFKNLIANLAVFPIAGAMFMLSAVFIHFSKDPSATIWTPPYTAAVFSNTGAVTYIVSLGILFAIPSVAGSVKEALKAKSPIQIGGGGGGGGGAMQWLSSAYYLRSMAPQGVLNRLMGKESKPADHG